MRESNYSSKTVGGPDRTEAKARWNPYLVGIGIGVLSWFAFGVLDEPLGISTALSSASSVCALPVMGGEGVAHNAYWAKNPLKLNGSMLLLIGTFLGSLLSGLGLVRDTLRNCGPGVLVGGNQI